jgi:hypothetical protein
MFRTAAREVKSVARASTLTHEFLRDRLMVTLIFSLVVNFVCAWLAFLFERDGKGTEITNFGDAVFWTSAQLLTVSSQMRNPVTTPGRVLDIFMEAYAIIVVTALAGSFGAFFHQRGIERREQRAASA